jgi:multisubunit Na+/H+ antiporter MnhC subunit
MNMRALSAPPNQEVLMKKIWLTFLGSIMVAAGAFMILSFTLIVPILVGLGLSGMGITLLLDPLRGRFVKRAPDYRYRAQELDKIFRGPPR